MVVALSLQRHHDRAAIGRNDASCVHQRMCTNAMLIE
jgi:hypothetical protein